MNVVGTNLIEEFCKRHERAKKAFDKWLPKVEEALWSKRLDAKATFPAADPWTGDVSYKLSNIRRADQSHTLFEAPADYQVKEGGIGFRRQGQPPPARQD